MQEETRDVCAVVNTIAIRRPRDGRRLMMLVASSCVSAQDRDR